MSGATRSTSPCSVHRRDNQPRERGGALLIALALLALSAALLAGAAQWGRLALRSAQSHNASVTSDAESRAVLAELMSAWSSSDDSLPVGRSRELTVGPRRVGAGGLVATSRVRLMRLSATRFVVGVECTVGPEGAISARRRLSLILDRRVPADTSAAPLPPAPIRQWCIGDLF